MELSSNIVPKSKIFVFGSCDVWDAVDISPIRREFDIDKYYYNDRPYDLDLDKGKLPIRSPSLLSLYTPPNSIANRVFDTMYSIRHKPPKIDHYWIYHEIVKFPYLKFYQENAGPNDILVCNFSAELYTKYVTSNEAFTIVPPMIKLLKNSTSPFSWLADELIKTQHHRCFDQAEVIGQNIDFFKQFTKELIAIFGDRCILVDTLLTEFSYTDTKNIVKLPTLQPRTDWIPFYKPTKIMVDPTDIKHIRRLANLGTKGFKTHYRTKIPFVTLDQADIWMDPFHAHGAGPFHHHRITSEKLGEKIYDELKKIRNKIETSTFGQTDC